MARLRKSVVHYRPSGLPPTDPAERCGNCSMFLKATGRCTLVEGHISAWAVCDRWEARHEVPERARGA